MRKQRNKETKTHKSTKVKRKKKLLLKKEVDFWPFYFAWHALAR
jgi:hypothetical protein